MFALAVYVGGKRKTLLKRGNPKVSGISCEAGNTSVDVGPHGDHGVQRVKTKTFRRNRGALDSLEALFPRGSCRDADGLASCAMDDGRLQHTKGQVQAFSQALRDQATLDADSVSARALCLNSFPVFRHGGVANKFRCARLARSGSPGLSRAHLRGSSGLLATASAKA